MAALIHMLLPLISGQLRPHRIKSDDGHHDRVLPITSFHRNNSIHHVLGVQSGSTSAWPQWVNQLDSTVNTVHQTPTGALKWPWWWCGSKFPWQHSTQWRAAAYCVKNVSVCLQCAASALATGAWPPGGGVRQPESLIQCWNQCHIIPL